MKALLDTNIIIHREASTIKSQAIGTLFKWLDIAKYDKFIHPISIAELQKHKNKKIRDTFKVKLQSYNEVKTIAPIATEIENILKTVDKDENDRNDTLLLNELFQGRVDIFISEDKKIHTKAIQLGISDQVFHINSFLEKVVSENPELINYDVLSVKNDYFGNINLKDPFFDSFRSDYIGFDQWFNSKSNDRAYVTHNKGKILSFLFLKIEGRNENYSDIVPIFAKKRRLKIGTFKVASNGVRLGERFLKIIFDNALQNKVDEIYVTIFDKTHEQKRLIDLLVEWGFIFHGTKSSANGEEVVLVRKFSPHYIRCSPKHSYPYLSADEKVFLCPIYPDYHTELFPDSILRGESLSDFADSQPHRNALSKVYISRSYTRNLSTGDIIIFYRTGGFHKSVISTIGIVENVVDNIKNEDEFIIRCRKRSVFTDAELKVHWNHREQNKPFIVNFLYTYSFPHRLNLAKLIELGIIANTESAPRGFTQISKEHFNIIIRETQTNESIIIN